MTWEALIIMLQVHLYFCQSISTCIDKMAQWYITKVEFFLFILNFNFYRTQKNVEFISTSIRWQFNWQTLWYWKLFGSVIVHFTDFRLPRYCITVIYLRLFPTSPTHSVSWSSFDIRTVSIRYNFFFVFYAPSSPNVTWRSPSFASNSVKKNEIVK